MPPPLQIGSGGGCQLVAWACVQGMALPPSDRQAACPKSPTRSCFYRTPPTWKWASRAARLNNSSAVQRWTPPTRKLPPPRKRSGTRKWAGALASRHERRGPAAAPAASSSDQPTGRQWIKKCTSSAESLDFREVSLGPCWTMLGALHPFKVAGLRPPTPSGTYMFAPGNDFFDFWS